MTTAEKPKLIGILGGIASGKSFVAAELELLGAKVIHADQLGHQVLTQLEVIKQLREKFGDEILDTQTASIDRKALAKHVFGPEPDKQQALEYLEQVTHPRIAALVQQQMEKEAKDPKVKAFVLDAPVMIKAGWHKKCDSILFVDASQQHRQDRALKRGWTVSEFEQREAQQESITTKRNLADFIIDNNGTKQQLREQVQTYWRQLLN